MPRSILNDTGVILRFGVDTDPGHHRAVDFIEARLKDGDVLYCAPQSIREAWSVLTRPASVNGFGFDVAKVQRFVRIVRKTFLLLDEGPEVFIQWELLVDRYGVQGKNVHDANLVAMALAHNVRHVATLNERDFRRFSEITLVPVAP